MRDRIAKKQAKLPFYRRNHTIVYLLLVNTVAVIVAALVNGNDPVSVNDALDAQ